MGVGFFSFFSIPLFSFFFLMIFRVRGVRKAGHKEKRGEKKEKRQRREREGRKRAHMKLQGQREDHAEIATTPTKGPEEICKAEEKREA